MIHTYDIRKTVVTVETIHHDGGPHNSQALRLAVAAVIMTNPFAGKYEPDLLPFMASLKPIATDLTRQMLSALRAETKDIQVFGKGSIVGTDGELEHAATWHAPGGAGMKEVLGARGFVSAGKMMGALGARLQIPLVYINSPWVRSHFNSIEFSVYDAPKPREIIFALAVGTGPRIHARLGGVTPEQAEAGDVPKY